MQTDFHYYATYCAAFLAGYSHEESLDICYSDQFTDHCSRTLISKLDGPMAAATTQLQMEMMDARTDRPGLQDITRIWSSFHFLPYDLYAEKEHATRRYLNKYRLICKPNGSLVADTVELAKGGSLQAAGIAMHILADTWAHQNFAGTPSFAINNTNYSFYELRTVDGKETRTRIAFRHNPTSPDDLDRMLYTNSIRQGEENTIMNLGHGRAGHFPDYSFARYCYLPAWGDFEEIVKDNPSDYYMAFAQMVYALKYLRGTCEEDSFELCRYDEESVAPYKDRITAILTKRQLDACEDWKAFGEELSGREIEDFDIKKYQDEYLNTGDADKNSTFLGRFFLSAIEHKSMVTERIYKSGNPLAGKSVDYRSLSARNQERLKKYFESAKRRTEK